MNPVLKIQIPKANHKRISYVVDYLIKTCLGLTYDLHIGKLQNQVSIKIAEKEIFLPCNLGDLHQTILPEELEIGIGKEKYKVINFFKKDPQEYSEIAVDIFCGTFWLLTQFEEYATPHFDNHNRFDLSKSILNTYSNRPIIQEYVELLFALIKKVNPLITRNDKLVRKIMSHDIDRLYKWRNIKALGGEVKRSLAGQSIWKTSQVFSSYISTKLGKISDPFDNLNLLSDIYQEQGWETVMYFGANVNQTNQYDHFDYDVLEEKTQLKLRNLRSKGVTIGLHPSYDSYCSYEKLVEEKDRLEQAIGEEIIHSRQHYLRFKNPDTFRILDEAGIMYDSSLGYYDKMGFRCGTSIPFETYDLENNQKLKLQEIPLLCMDTHNQQMDQDIENTIKTVEKYGGTVMVLIHNSSDYLLKKILGHE